MAYYETSVDRGLAYKQQENIYYLSVDEKSRKKGHAYFTLVYNLEKGTVEYISDEPKTDSLEAYFNRISEEKRFFIKAVAMDIWDPSLY